jgi:hypothetical protein
MPNWSDFEPYLRGDMLPPNKKITVTIERVAIEETHPKGGAPVKTPVLYFKGKTKGLPLSTINTRTMRLLFGDDMNKAVGQKIIIRCEPKRIAGVERTPIYVYPAEGKGEGEVTE